MAFVGCRQLQLWLYASYRMSTTALDKQSLILTAAERRLAEQTTKCTLVVALYHRENNCFPAEANCVALPTGKSGRQEILLLAGILFKGNFIHRATSRSVIALGRNSAVVETLPHRYRCHKVQMGTFC